MGEKVGNRARDDALGVSSLATWLLLTERNLQDVESGVELLWGMPLPSLVNRFTQPLGSRVRRSLGCLRGGCDTDASLPVQRVILARPTRQTLVCLAPSQSADQEEMQGRKDRQPKYTPRQHCLPKSSRSPKVHKGPGGTHPSSQYNWVFGGPASAPTVPEKPNLNRPPRRA